MQGKTLILHGPGINIICDPSQIFPNDPGQGQPVYVETVVTRSTRYHSASWDCAMDTGELSCGDYQLTEAQKNWLASQEDRVEEWKRWNKV